MKIVVISCSLHPLSRSYILALQAVEDLKRLNAEVQLYDLRDYDIDFCDAVNGLMAVPNLIALIALSPVVAGLSCDYIKRMKG